MANNNTTTSNGYANQIDAANLYGLKTNTGCLQGTCPPNTLNMGYYIPSLAEIAAYNQSAPPIANVINPNSMQQNQSSLQTQPSMQPRPQTQTPLTGNEQIMPSQNIPETPATTLDYGATMGTTVREDLGMSITDIANPYPVTPESIQYLNGFIRTQIGRRVTIDFLVGSNNMVSKSGYLLGVASNYILINELDTNDITTCDFYNIKFIRFYY